MVVVIIMVTVDDGVLVMAMAMDDGRWVMDGV